MKRPLLAAVAQYPLAAAGLAIIVIISLVAIAAPLIAPYDPNQIDLMARLHPPSWQHLAGTDEVGRDVFSRIVYGARASLGVGVGVVAIGAIVGTLLGLFSGLSDGWMDAALMRAMDAMMALPSLVIALALTAALGPSLVNAMIALGALSVPHYTRLARSQALSIRETGYVKASRTMGASTWYQLRQNIFPNAISPILVFASLNVGSAILAAASFSFIGLGAQPPLPEWGAMISSGRSHIIEHWWIPLMPGFAIAFTVLGFNLLGDGLNEVLDPRTRKQ